MLENYSPLSVCFRSEQIKPLFDSLVWLLPLILSAANKTRKTCRTVYCDRTYLLPKLMSEVLRGRHNFLFNRPWCIFLTLFCFITLWICLSLLVYRKPSGQSVTRIQKATRQIHGAKNHAPSMLPQWTKCNWEPGPVSLPILVSRDLSHICKVWYELVLATVSQLYTMYIRAISAHFQDRQFRFSKTKWLTHCSLTIHLWSVNDELQAPVFLSPGENVSIIL